MVYSHEKAFRRQELKLKMRMEILKKNGNQAGILKCKARLDECVKRGKT